MARVVIPGVAHHETQRGVRRGGKRRMKINEYTVSDFRGKVIQDLTSSTSKPID